MHRSELNLAARSRWRRSCLRLRFGRGVPGAPLARGGAAGRSRLRLSDAARAERAYERSHENQSLHRRLLASDRTDATKLALRPDFQVPLQLYRGFSKANATGRDTPVRLTG